MSEPLEKVLDGVDASRRAAWAKFYQSQKNGQVMSQIALVCTGVVAFFYDMSEAGTDEWNAAYRKAVDVAFKTVGESLQNSPQTTQYFGELAGIDWRATAERVRRTVLACRDERDRP